MNIRSSRLFPHPVLWFANDDYFDSDFTIKIQHEQAFGKFRLNYEFELKNEDILNRIRLGEISFCLHIECSLTMFRLNHITNNLIGSVEIGTESITHKVEVLPLIVAMADIDDFTASGLNEDYRGLRLSVQKGTIMGVSDYRYYIIDKDTSDIGKKESIFSFVRNQKQEPMQIETSDDRIIIKLKDDDFKNLQMLQTSSKYKPVIFSMFIVPGLIYALDSVGENDIDNMRELLWFRSLEKCFKSNGLVLDKATINQKTSYALSQMLLEDPISKALIALNESGD